jgi:hypothetical protein
MGYGSYSHAAHEALTSARAALPQQQVFSRRDCHPLMNPFGVKLRESRDSRDHPLTTSIVFALDVSGSMGEIPRQMAQKELPTFMKTLLDTGVTDPQVLFMAFQDAAGPDAPLQVGQFESTAELIDQWLTWTWLIGGGYSAYESYDMAFYFAAHHTRLDSFEKRGKKGYLFMSGDEPCYTSLRRDWVATVIGDALPADPPLETVIAEVRRTYHPFFLIPDPQRGRGVHAFWRGQLGEGAIVLGAPEDTCAVAAGIVALSEDRVASLDALGASLARHGMDAHRVARVTDAMRHWATSIGKT